MQKTKILIIGAGPCGIGAAWRMKELGEQSFTVIEQKPHVGGLASTFKDARGFLWDIGGHVVFSHYPYFTNVMDEVLPGGWNFFERNSFFIWNGQWIRYPIQDHLNEIPFFERTKMILSFLKRKNDHGEDFKSWLNSTFGTRITRLILEPYNTKVWATPPDRLSHLWTSERVSTPKTRSMLLHLVLNSTSNWGPNKQFRYPRSGGTGAIWESAAKKIGAERFQTSTTVTSIDVENRIVRTDRGSIRYEHLISTIPLDILATICIPQFKKPDLAHSSTMIVGIGMRGHVPEKLRSTSWIYFGDRDIAPYRATVFSNYSESHTPDPNRYWSLMCEVSEPALRRTDPNTIKSEVIDQMETLGICDSRSIESVWTHREEYGYPIPTLNRERELSIIADLERQNIYSRGRFGGWRYEVSNQDHSFMQGVEVIDRIIRSVQESTYTRVRTPDDDPTT